MYRIIIAGGRDFNNFKMLEESVIDIILKYIGKGKRDQIEIVSGKARGADSLGEEFAKKYGLRVAEFFADWDSFGKSAGRIRNKQMAEYSIADGNIGILIAFWDRKSRGTKSMIELGKKHELNVEIRIY